MSDRFCPTCATEVEDTGGYCLLGHSLRLSAPTDSLAGLRAEVNRAFEEAELQMAMARHPASGSLQADPRWGIPLPAFAAFPEDSDEIGVPVAFGEFELEDTPSESTVTPAPAPAPQAPARAAQAPAVIEPATPAQTPPARDAGVWQAIEGDTPLVAGDPITAFSPPPRMDWGPDRPKLFRRRSERRFRSADI